LEPEDQRSQRLVILDFHVFNNERFQQTWRFVELTRATRTSQRKCFKYILLHKKRENRAL